MTAASSPTFSHLFSLPIHALPSTGEKAVVGSIECTTTSSSSGPVYILTFFSPPDNRLLSSFLQALILALDILEFLHPHGVIVTTSGIPKFYSNGLDVYHSRETPRFFPDQLYAVFRRLLTYPMPTVALVNGHAFAGGCMLAMYHDYRVMNPSRGFLCLNELDLGIPLQPAMSSIFRQKLKPSIYKLMVLEARRFTGKQALEGGLVDMLGGIPEAIALIDERKLAAKPGTRIYGLLRVEMFRETLSYIDNYDKEEKMNEEFMTDETKRRDVAMQKVEKWKAVVKKSKL
ncbi:hypothetical protein K3495_g4210 [Podosphaera aphanis]|nr:hypothetical protein K3495_g4210 [Podosphaera aphanis]